MRFAGILVCLAIAVPAATSVAVASPYGLLAPADDPLVYCAGGLDAGVTGAYTDAEHDVRLPDDPLPTGVTQQRLTVDGVGTRLLRSGPATAEEAVVFVHGNPDSARDFDALLARTGRFGRAVAFDMPGYGRADDGAGLDYSTTGAARFIERALELLGIQRVHLVLHDFGGSWGLQWATTHLPALRSVTLLDGGLLVGFVGHPTALTFSTPVAGEAFMAVTDRVGFKTLIGAQNPLPERFLDRLYDDYDRATRCAILHYYRSLEDPDALGRRQAAILRPADVPALVVWGARDPYVPVSVAGRQTLAFPRARIEVLPGIGHWPLAEAADRTERLVSDFLAERVAAPRLLARVLRARHGDRRLSVRLSVADAARTPGVRLVLKRGGRVVGATRARTVDGVPRRMAITLSRGLRRGGYSLELHSTELALQRQAIRVR
ncbi:MAG: hypothetical protein QOI64_2040 [Solirubrobacteraceae bacterium]|nr:hypothetical protein [Solirubrobacteraceae bacterium]